MPKISRKELLIGAAVVSAAGVAYVYSKQDKPKTKTVKRPSPGPFKATKAAPSPKFDEEVMTKKDPDAKYAYTSFFTPESESLVKKDLQEWRSKNNPNGQCTFVTGTDPSEFGVGTFTDHLKEARHAAASVLEKRYPNEKWRPYNMTPGTPEKPSEPLTASAPLWQRWLYKRVENLADVEVCSYIPPRS